MRELFYSGEVLISWLNGQEWSVEEYPAARITMRPFVLNVAEVVLVLL
jgi:hypothetical protein